MQAAMFRHRVRMALKPELSFFQSMSHRELVRRYEHGVGMLPASASRLDHALLDRKFPPGSEAGEWSVRMVIGHIADAEIAFTHRMRRIAAEERPQFAVWDENQFIAREMYHGDLIIEVLEAIKGVRIWTASWLSTLLEKDFGRIGIHPERGEQTLQDVLVYNVWHLEHHAWYLHRKLEALEM